MGCLNCGAILFKEGKKVFFEGKMFCDINCLNEWLNTQQLKGGMTMGNKNDMVNHPTHYNTGRVEVIDIIEDATKGLEGIQAVCLGNVLKYTLRFQHKNGLEDLKKAQWYLNKLIEVMTDEAF